MDQITLGDGAAVFPNLIRVAAKHIAVCGSDVRSV